MEPPRMTNAEKEREDRDPNRDIHTLQRNISNLSCRTHSSLASKCIFPAGLLRSLYRDGTWISCELEVRNFNECLNIMYSVSQRQAKLDAFHEKIEKEKQEFRNNHVWTFRTEPPEEFNKFNPEYKHLFADSNNTNSNNNNNNNANNDTQS